LNQAPAPKTADATVLAKLEADPRYFVETFLWIIDKERRRVPLLFNPAQEAYYNAKTARDLILKARKEGFSTLIEALFLHACLFKPNVHAVTMAHTLDDTVIHLERVKQFVETMGLENTPIAPDVDKANMREISFPRTNSRYWIGTAGSKAFGRGRDITHLHLSEVAHYEDQTVLTAVMEACVPKAEIKMETTANGVGELFYKLWEQANDANSGSPWKPHFFAWFEDPTNRLPLPQGVPVRWNALESRMIKQYGLDDQQAYWYRQKRLGMVDQSKMPQEYPSNAQEAFLASGRHVFNLGALQKMKTRCSAAQWLGEVYDDGQTVEFVESPEGRLKVWKHPRHGRHYLIAADTAEGVPEGDFSVAQVLDRGSWEQVAVWRGRVDQGTFGEILTALGYYFNNALLVPENNNTGWATIERIKGLRYPHLLRSSLLWPDDKNVKDGFPTNEKTKGLLITALRNSVDEQTGFVNDIVTVGELMTYVQHEDGKMGNIDTQDGHDDCVMSLGIGIYSLKFLSVDETYQPRAQSMSAGMIVSQVAGYRGQQKGRGGYRGR
jgi:hypothetical protein